MPETAFPKESATSISSQEALPLSSRIRVRTLFTDILLWSVLCVLLSIGFSNINAVSERYPSISLRFDEEVSGQSAYAARQYSIKYSEEDTFWPTFWQEEHMSILSEYAAVETDGIYFSGDANTVRPAEYLTGAVPGVADRAGCALSESLAFRLWGGADVVGKTVEINEVKYIVRGVFEGEDDLALVSAGDESTSRGWKAAELTGGPDGATRDDIENYSIASDLGKPGAILNGAPVLIAGIMAILPLFIMACYGLGMLISWLLKSHRIARQITLLVLTLGFAALLPTLLDAMPDWLIPGSWSDFSFWESLVQQFDDSIMEFFRMTPQIRDAEGNMLLLTQACIAYAGTICALLVCFRWHIGQKKKICRYHRMIRLYNINREI